MKVLATEQPVHAVIEEASEQPETVLAKHASSAALGSSLPVQQVPAAGE